MKWKKTIIVEETREETDIRVQTGEKNKERDMAEHRGRDRPSQPVGMGSNLAAAY
jgi:hypothetical protein